LQTLIICPIIDLKELPVYFSGEVIMKGLDRITINPEICLGQPTIRRMRITVSIILKQIASGMTTKELLNDYPELEEEDIIQALQYAAWLSSEKMRVLPGWPPKIPQSWPLENPPSIKSR